MDRVSRGQWFLRVTASSAAFAEMGGRRFPKGGLLCGNSEHKGKQKHCPEGTEAVCPHGDLDRETHLTQHIWHVNAQG